MRKKILLVNKFYYNRGGAEVVAINLENEQTHRGYDVSVFTMDYKDNFKADNLYYASNVDFNSTIFHKIKFALRTLGYGDIVKSFKSTLNTFNPDIVHFHNVHSYLSPIIIKLAKEHGCKVVWTIHDYKIMCPSYSCLNNNKVCEKCFIDKSHILRHKCLKGSFMASALAYLEAKKWNKKFLEKNTDFFICPSNFMAQQMIKSNFDASKIKVICNFVDPIKSAQFLADKLIEKEDYYTYIGRLSPEKGVGTLLKAASKLPFKLKIAGGGPLAKEFMAKYKNNSNIEFLGHLNAHDVSTLLKKARAVISPSECYENNPLSVIEALCAGTPVIGANIGGIPELITPENGLLFKSGDKDELADAITTIMSKKEYDYNAIKTMAFHNFSAEKHFNLLNSIYN